MEEKERECEELRKAMRFMTDYARVAFKAWGHDEDNVVGRMLSAMSGLMPGYSAEVDAALALIGMENGRRD